MTDARRGRCPACHMDGLPVTDRGVMWSHTDPNPYVERRCPGSGQKPVAGWDGRGGAAPESG